MSIVNKTKYYSICCTAYMPRYPDSDICPECGEHTEAITEEEIDRENEEKSQRFDERRDLVREGNNKEILNGMD